MEARAAQQDCGRENAEERQELRQRPDLRIEALGSGTDFTAYLDHLGIASLNLAYEGEDEQGIYHSIYDDFYWYTHFSDTDFVYGRASGADGWNVGHEVWLTPRYCHSSL